MNKINKYSMSVFGEFKDKSIENEFLYNSMSSLTKITAHITIIIGIIHTLFLGIGYISTDDNYSLLLITIISIILLIISTVIFLFIKHITGHKKFIYVLTFYEICMSVGFLIVLEQYNTLSYISVFSLMTIILSIYLLPNKIMISQIISVLLISLFFISPYQKIVNLHPHDAYVIISYQVILLMYCNLSIYITNINKRKQFIKSKKLLALSNTDPMTGISNRAKFDDELDKCINYSNRYDFPLSLIIFDVDNFKKVNDLYGHLVGDEVLKGIVSAIKNSIRNTDVFARWGGEEFAILLPNTDIEQAESLAERMRTSVNDSQLHEIVKDITCSFGIAVLEKDDTATSFLRKADDLLLQAKADGKDMVATECAKIN